MYSRFDILKNPFVDFSARVLLSVSLVCTLLISWYASHQGIAFQGAIGARSGQEVSFFQNLLTNLSAISTMALFYYVYALFRKLPIRLIDAFVVCATARIIIYLITLSTGLEFIKDLSLMIERSLAMGDLTLASMPKTAVFFLSVYGLLLVAMLIYYLVFLVTGLRYVSNSKHKLDAIAIVCLLIIAQLIL